MTAGDAPRTVSTQAGIAIVMTCHPDTPLNPGLDWSTSAEITATTDIGPFTLVNGTALQVTGDRGSAIQPQHHRSSSSGSRTGPSSAPSVTSRSRRTNAS